MEEMWFRAARPWQPARAFGTPARRGMSDLHSALRAWRSQKAQSLSQPAFCVFSNAELDRLVASCPHSTDALLRVQGFGKAKVQKFGEDIVRICKDFEPSLHPPAPAPAAKRKLPAFKEDASNASSSRPKLTTKRRSRQSSGRRAS